MKRIFGLAILLALLALPLVGCTQFGLVSGSGSIIDKTYDFKDFAGVEISNNFQYEITQSNTYSVVISTHENLIQYLDVHQSGSTLIVRFQSGSYNNTDAKAVISLPKLNNLDVSGASRGTAKGLKSTEDLGIKVSGASKLDMDIESGKTNFNVSGASNVTGNLKTGDTQINVSGASGCDVTGTAASTTLEISGASHMNSPNLILQNADAHVSGASRVTVNTHGTLNVEVTGASNLTYSGNPTLGKVTVNGASKMQSN